MLTLKGHWSNREDCACMCLVKLIDRAGRVFPETERASCFKLKTVKVIMEWMWHTKTKRMQWLTTIEEDREATWRRCCMWKLLSPSYLFRVCPTRVKSFFQCLFLLWLHHSFNTDPLTSSVYWMLSLPLFFFSCSISRRVEEGLEFITHT